MTRTARTTSLTLLLALCLAACGNDAQTPTPAGGALPDFAGPPADLTPLPPMTFRYVVDKIRLPQGRTEYAADLNGDGKAENRFGDIVSALSSQVNLQMQEDMTLAMGDGLNLLSFVTTDATLKTDPAAALTVYTAERSNPPDFSGAGTFTVDTTVKSGKLAGPLAGGMWKSADPLQLTSPPTVYLRIVLGAGVSVNMPIVGARMSFGAGPAALGVGQLNGAMKKTDVDAILIPGLATSLDKMANEVPCGQSCMQVRSLFDTNKDGSVTLGEVQQNGLVMGLLSPDVQLFDGQGTWKPNADNITKDSISMGVSFSAVKATFKE